MSLYNFDKLVQETRKLCVEWHAQGRATGMTGEIAAYDAARLLDLELVDNKNLGYAAIGRGKRAGQRILIKGRAIFKEHKSRARIGQLNLEQEWDLILLVILDAQFETYEIYEATRAQVDEAVSPDDFENRKGPMSVAKFKNISSLVWPTESEMHATGL